MHAPSVGVIGAGAWGTALAQVAAKSQQAAGGSVQLWCRDPAAAAEINRSRKNNARLPGVTLAPNLTATSVPSALAACGIVLIATPAQTVRQVLQRLSSVHQPLVLPLWGHLSLARLFSVHLSWRRPCRLAWQ